MSARAEAMDGAAAATVPTWRRHVCAFAVSIAIPVVPVAAFNDVIDPSRPRRAAR